MATERTPRPEDTSGARPTEERDPSQAWYWTPDWQEGEREADADLAAGRTWRQENTEEFLAFLRTRPLPDADA